MVAGPMSPMDKLADVADLTLERLPPQNVEAEMAVLGAMLIEENAIAEVMELLDERAFYRDVHRIIFAAAVDLYNHGKAVDLVTLADELRRQGVLDEVGGVASLTMLSTAVPTAANVKHYARIVKEKYLLRSLIHTATKIVQEAYEATDDVDALIDKAEHMIFDVAMHKVESAFVPLREIIRHSIETIDQFYQRKAHVTGLATGFYEFDVMTAGLQESDFIVVAGRPSMGKSAWAMCVSEHVSIQLKLPVAIFSLEMSKEQLVQRMLCAHARVDAHKVRTGYLSHTDWPKLTAAAGKLSEAPIFIDDTPGISVFELRAKARRLQAQHSIRLIIVDYLQLMRGPSRVENRQQEISEISRALKALARELKVPIVAISQLSRAVETRSDRRPQLSDLRESGAIEQDADLVSLLLREEYYNPTEDNKGLAELIIAKQRNGPVGSMKLAFIKEYARFENLAPQSD